MIEARDQTEGEFLADYDPSRYPAFGVTADVAVFTIVDRKLSVLLVERVKQPQRGRWALPGGFLATNESAEQTARRHLLEESGLHVDPSHLEQLRTYSTPGRDPRDEKVRVVSIAHVALIPEPDTPVAADDRGEARFWPLDELIGLPLAFDHAEIITEAIDRVRSKLEYTTVATGFLEDAFTLGELRDIYEIVWGVDLDSANFSRKIRAIPGFVSPTEGRRKTSGRSAQLYVAGDTHWMLPPMLRPA